MPADDPISPLPEQAYQVAAPQPADDAEREALLTEHRALARKTFEAGLSSAESRRLAYVRWQLDRIHEARDAGRLDELAALAALGERVAAHIDAFRQEVNALRPAPPSDS